MARIPQEIVETLQRTSKIENGGAGNQLVDISNITTPEKLYKVKSRLHNAEDVAWLPGGRLVVADKIGGVIRVFDEGGECNKTLQFDCKPYGVETNRSGMVLYTDHKDRRGKMVKVLNWESGHMFSEWGDELSWNPRGICMNNKGQIVVTNVDVPKLKHEVGIYTIDGKLISQLGRYGNRPTEFDCPYYVHVDVYDRILVSDQDNNCVKLFDDREGHKLLGIIGKNSRKSVEGNLIEPRGLTSDSKGNIFVSDTGNNRVCMYSADGSYVRTLLSKDDFLHFPVGIAFNRQSGHLAVAQHNSITSSGSFRKLSVYALTNGASES